MWNLALPLRNIRFQLFVASLFFFLLYWSIAGSEHTSRFGVPSDLGPHARLFAILFLGMSITSLLLSLCLQSNAFERPVDASSEMDASWNWRMEQAEPHPELGLVPTTPHTPGLWEKHLIALRELGALGSGHLALGLAGLTLWRLSPFYSSYPAKIAEGLVLLAFWFSVLRLVAAYTTPKDKRRVFEQKLLPLYALAIVFTPKLSILVMFCWPPV